MNDKQKTPQKKATDKKKDKFNGQLEVTLAEYKPQVGEKKFKKIVKKTAKLITKGIKKAKEKKSDVIKNKIVPKKIVPKKIVSKKIVAKKVKTT